MIRLGSPNWRAKRHRMVRHDLQRRGITDRRVLAAMASVPREAFVPTTQQRQAYADQPLPIGDGQTISQPYMVALMTAEAAITRVSCVLEIGTGSGYQTAVLAKIASHVWTIERVSRLVTSAAERLRKLGMTNVSCIEGDGALGHPCDKPYDAILVTAAAPWPPTGLLDQLATGGRLAIPIGDRAGQRLTIYEKTAGGVGARASTACRFVPLVSPHAFDK